MCIPARQPVGIEAGGAGKRGRQECRLILPSKKKESGSSSRSLVVFADLVVFRVHGGPAADLVADEPQLRRDLVDISDLAGVVRIARGEAALCSEDRGEGSIEVAAKGRSFGFNEWPKVVEEMPCHAVD